MKIQQFLEHHGIARNPFAEEDAQTDPVFKDHCIDGTHHPSWDKVYGDPEDPSTSVVFGEKGAGKTAMRLQVARHLEQYNLEHSHHRCYVIHYDDFNPFLDRFRERLHGRRRRADRVLSEWRLWDHMDAILTLGVTSLVDQVLDGSNSGDGSNGSGIGTCRVDVALVKQLDRHQCRDLLLLAACYDQSTAETAIGRWNRLRRKLKYRTLTSQWDLALGGLATVAVVALVAALMAYGQWDWLRQVWLYVALLLVGWAPWLWRATRCWWRAKAIVRHVRVGNLEQATVRKILRSLAPCELASQPLPDKDRTDDRYELLSKFQGILHSLGFSGTVVLVDRVDEPYLINGSPELMRALLWPMLDNKFLKQPGFGLKMMLPIELSHYIEREDRDFYQRARLDKQNMIPSLEWTGEALYDIANGRIRGCAADGQQPALTNWFDDTVSEQRLLDALRILRVPRHLFKFLYRLLVAHSSAHTDQSPSWKISRETFESALAVFTRDQDALDRGLGVG